MALSDDVKHQLTKPYVPYSDEIADKIIDAVESGATILSLSGLDDYPSRRSVYNWLDEHPEFNARFEKAERIKSRCQLDEIEEQSKISNIDTILTSADGKLSTHSAGVAAVELSNKWKKWKASLSNNRLRDDVSVNVDLGDDKSPDAQLLKLTELAAGGKITLNQAEKIAGLIKSRIEMTELKELKELLAEQSRKIEQLTHG